MDFIDNYLCLLVEAPKIGQRRLNMWIVWTILSVIVFTKLTTGEFINYESTLILWMAMGLICSLKIFSHRYEGLLTINRRKLLLLLYVPNISLIFLKELVDITGLILGGYDLHVFLVVNEGLFITFWLLSIPMVLIRKQVYCLINMLLIIILITLFSLILNNCICQLSNIIILTVTILLIAGSLILGVLQSMRRLSAVTPNIV